MCCLTNRSPFNWRTERERERRGGIIDAWKVFIFREYLAMFYAAATWPDCKTARRGNSTAMRLLPASEQEWGGKKVAKVLPTLNSGAEGRWQPEFRRRVKRCAPDMPLKRNCQLAGEERRKKELWCKYRQAAEWKPRFPRKIDDRGFRCSRKEKLGLLRNRRKKGVPVSSGGAGIKRTSK